MSARRRTKVLLIEDNPGDVRLICEALGEVPGRPFAVECARRLGEGLARLCRSDVDSVLLDLSLPDSRGLETLGRAIESAPEVPIVVLTGTDDDALAFEAVQAGAQDYLVKGRFDAGGLARSLRYAIERHRLQAELRKLSLTDDLTGLNNRRGFTALAGQQLKLARARRGRARPVLVFADMDGLKQINDTFGHQEGSRAIVETADILRRTFRESDILARWGGDEFAVLAIDPAGGRPEILTDRLKKNLEASNARRGSSPYRLSLSVGVAQVPPGDSASVEELVTRADRAMYKDKKARR